MRLFMKFYFLEFCLDWLIFLQNDLKRSGLDYIVIVCA